MLDIQTAFNDGLNLVTKTAPRSALSRLPSIDSCQVSIFHELRAKEANITHEAAIKSIRRQWFLGFKQRFGALCPTQVVRLS
ncbi:MAG: hypothetical protein ACOH2M_11325 [Cypionkella sp.]